MAGLDPADPDLEAAQKPLDWLGVEFWPDGEFKPEEQLLRQPFAWAPQSDPRQPADLGAEDGADCVAAGGPHTQQVSPTNLHVRSVELTPFTAGVPAR